MSEYILLAATAAGFLLVGVALGYFLSQRRAGVESARTEEVQNKFDAYRQEVTEHFGRTAEHFQSIGQQYRELYEHMASGADSLCDRQDAGDALSFAPAAIAEADADDRSEAPADYSRAGLADEPDTTPVADISADDATSESPEREEAAEVSSEPKPEDTGGSTPRTYH